MCWSYSFKQKRIINEYILIIKAVLSEIPAKYWGGGYNVLLSLIKNDSVKNAGIFFTQ